MPSHDSVAAAEADHVGDLRPADGRRERDRLAGRLAERDRERLDRRDPPGGPSTTRASSAARAAARSRASRRASRRPAACGSRRATRSGGGLPPRRRAGRGGPARTPIARDRGERAVVVVDAHVLAAEPDHGGLAAGPPDPLGVAQRARVDEERHAGDRIGREVHADRQALPHVEVFALRIGRARDEPELAREHVGGGPERVRIRGEQREEHGVGCRCGTGRRRRCARRSPCPHRARSGRSGIRPDRGSGRARGAARRRSAPAPQEGHRHTRRGGRPANPHPRSLTQDATRG